MYLAFPGTCCGWKFPCLTILMGSRGRADIIVHGIEDAIQELYPLAVVECKNENVILTDQTVDQAIRYCDTIGGRYVIVYKRDPA